MFYGLAACSWMPHWACHYYRLETHSTFVVGSWSFSPRDSVVSLVIYSVLIALNLLAISVGRYQFVAAALTSIGHLSIGCFISIGWCIRSRLRFWVTHGPTALR
jgi:hypothetical protein